MRWSHIFRQRKYKTIKDKYIPNLVQWFLLIPIHKRIKAHAFETVWKFLYTVLRFSGWAGQTVSEYPILGERQFQIFLDKYSPLTALQTLYQVDEEEAGSLVLSKPLCEGWLVHKKPKNGTELSSDKKCLEIVSFLTTITFHISFQNQFLNYGVFLLKLFWAEH